jgi:hypothetical protein
MCTWSLFRSVRIRSPKSFEKSTTGAIRVIEMRSEQEFGPSLARTLLLVRLLEATSLTSVMRYVELNTG